MKFLKKVISSTLVVCLLLQPAFTSQANAATSQTNAADATSTKENATSLIDSPYRFGLSNNYIPISPTMSMKDIYEELRSELPDEVPVVMPKVVKGDTKFYVSTTGNDNNLGNILSPYLTVQKALLSASKLKDSIKSKGVIIYLRGGNYTFTDELKINGTMSGTKKFPLFISAYAKEEVTITSANVLTSKNFTSVTDNAKLALLPKSSRGKVVVADLKSLGITDYDQILHGIGAAGPEARLYWNNSEMTLARYPNFTTIPVGTVLDQGPITRTQDGATTDVVDDGRGATIKVNDPTPFTWKDTSDIFISGSLSFQWLPAQYKVRDINAAANTISTADTTMYGAREQTGNEYYFFNVFESLDVPGEWYLDRDAGKLYIYPFENFDKASIYLSTDNTDLVSVDNAQHVYFNRLNLKASAGSGFTFNNSENIVVQNCNISFMNKIGISMNTCTYSGVTSSIIYNTDGVAVASYGNEAKDNLLIPSRNFVQNNFITRQGNESQETGYIGGSMGDIVSHNLFQKFAASAARPTGNDSIFEYNEIQGSPFKVGDMGAIYTGDIGSPYHTDRFNYIHDMSVAEKDGVGIYYDVFGSGFMAYGNVINNFKTGIFSHGGRNNVFVNNILANTVNSSPVAVKNSTNYWNPDDNSWKQQILDTGSIFQKDYLGKINMLSGPYSTRYPMWTKYLTDLFAWTRSQVLNPSAPRSSLEDSLRAPSGSYIANNISYNSGEFTFLDIEKPVIGSDTNVTTDKDPGFVNYSAGDLSLAADSDVYTNMSGFETVPFDKMGLITNSSCENLKYVGIGIKEAPTAVYPANNSEGQESFDKVEFKWTDVMGAGCYELTVAKDRNFSDVVLTKKVDNSTVTVELSGINTQYFWKVKAIPVAKSLVQKEVMSKVFSFTTMTFDEMNAVAHADKTALATQITSAKALLNIMVDGTAVGQYKAGSKDALQNAINTAIDEYNKNNIQAFINKANDKLISEVNKIRLNVVVGFSDVVDYTDKGWVEIHNPSDAPNPENPAEVTYVNGVVSMKVNTDGSSRIALNQPMNMGTLYTFGMKMDSTDGWFVLGDQGDRAADFSRTNDYCIIIKGDVLELQKYSESKAYWIIDTAQNDNKVIVSNTWHDYAFGTFAEGDGVRVIFMVDGKTVINFHDNNEPLYYEGNLVIQAHNSNKNVYFTKSKVNYSEISVPTLATAKVAK